MTGKVRETILNHLVSKLCLLEANKSRNWSTYDPAGGGEDAFMGNYCETDVIYIYIELKRI